MDMTWKHGDFVYTDWNLIETRFDPKQIHHRETTFTIGNGYLGTRGGFEEGYPRSNQATLIHGVFDDVPIVYTELANCPDWLPLEITIITGDAPGEVTRERFRLDRGEILEYERLLDLRRALLRRKIRWRSPSGKTIDLEFERFASRADTRVLAIQCAIAAVDFSGKIEVQASLNGYPENQGYNHWELLDQSATTSEIWLHLRTRSSRIELGMASRLHVVGTGATITVANPPGYPTQIASFPVTPGQRVTVEKLVTFSTSRYGEKPLKSAQGKLAVLPSYYHLKTAHIRAWNRIWHYSDVAIEGETRAALAVRYNLFQLLIAAPHDDDRVSIAAKTLSGFGYRGHVFWDTEIFILPFFIFTQPELAKNLLTYRYKTLDGARRKAAHYGYKGAMYAWESGDTGDEITPRWLPPNDPYGEDIRIWCRDREIHISADVAYAVWSYWQATGDDEWMRDCGAEIILDTAVFWGSRVEYNTKNEKYEIKGVIGADEYHENCNNNTFTNRMVQWHLEKALRVHDWLRGAYPQKAGELDTKLQITVARRNRWQDIIDNITINYDAHTGLIEQHDGFFQLKDIDLQTYEPRYKSMQTILGIEGANHYQVLKQPDVLMLLYLMRQSQEFPYTPENLRVNWEYYAPRTDITYGSSLGPAIHAILAADLNQSEQAYHNFIQAAVVDIEDTRGNAHEGIHGASAGGIWQAVVFGFGGVQFSNSGPIAKPQLPPTWTRLQFKIHWCGKWHNVDITPGSAQVTEFHTPQPIPMVKNTDIAGFIFDLDGVLTDTAEYHYRAWQRLADEEGIPFDRTINEELRGVSRRASLLRIIGDRKYSEEELEIMMTRKNNYYVESIENITPADLLPGAGELLDELRSAGIKIALGSASKNARPVLEKLGIADKIDVVADGYSVVNPKPAPDLFLYAAREMQLTPNQCVVVEDASAGIDAALAAGMCAIGLGPQERVGHAHVVLPSLASVTWQDIQARLQGVQPVRNVR